MNSDEYRRRYDALLALVSKRLPSFIEAVASDEEILILHQDAFAAGWQDEELALLGAAIKFAGHHGKPITINRALRRDHKRQGAPIALPSLNSGTAEKSRLL